MYGQPSWGTAHWLCHAGVLPKHEAHHTLKLSQQEKHDSSYMPELDYVGRHVPGPASEELLYSTHRCTGNAPHTPRHVIADSYKT